MAIYIELTTSQTSRKTGLTAGTKSGGNLASRAGKSSARRPLRGIEIKDDTYASLKVLLPNGEELPLIDSSSRTGRSVDGTTNFILQSVSEARAERNQIIQTFGGAYVFFFGEEPRFLDCQAVLLNTLDFNWEAEWWANYNCYLRGTKLVEMGARCFLAYDDTVVEGFIMGAQSSKSADQPHVVQLAFKFFVTGCYNVTSIGDPKYPVRGSLDMGEIDLYSQDATHDIFFSQSGLKEIVENSKMEAEQQGDIAERRSEQSMFQNMAEDMGNAWDSAVDRFQNGPGEPVQLGIPPTFGVPPAVWRALMSSTTDPNVIDELADDYLNQTYGHGNLRSYIADNTDEWAGGEGNGYEAGSNDEDARVYDSNVPICLIMGAANYGGLGNSLDLLKGLGQMPNFLGGTGQATMSPVLGNYSSTGIGYNATAGGALPYGTYAGGGYVGSLASQNGYVAGASYTAGIGPNGPYSQSSSYSGVTRSPGLASVYGVPPGQAQSDYYASMARYNPMVGNDYSYQQSVADNTYVAGANYNLLTGESNSFAGKLADAPPGMGFGYPSPYATGPGYGQAGYGNFGGFPYGAGVRADPAYLSPQSVDVQSQDITIGGMKVGESRTWSGSGVSGYAAGSSAAGAGGASFMVGGASTSFGQVAMPGTLAPYGNAPTFAAAQSSVGAGAGVSVTAGLSLTAGLGLGTGVGMPSGVCGRGGMVSGLGAQVSIGASVVAGAQAMAGIF